MAYSNFTENSTKIKFLTGAQSTLDGKITSGGAVEGAFYLTNDTHRLYIGRKSTTDNKVYPVPVNEGVITVANENGLDELASEGQMCYVTSLSALVIRSGGQWVQINPDTYLLASNADTSVTAATNGVEVAHEIQDTKNGTTGVHKSKGSFTVVKGNDNVLVSKGTDNEIKIGAKDTVTSLAVDGSTSVEVNDKQATRLTFTQTPNNADGTTGTAVTTALDFAAGDYMDSIEYDSTNGTVTFNAQSSAITKAQLSTLADGGFGLAVATKANSSDVTSSINPTIKVGDTSYEFKSGVATLANVYTKSQVDTAIANASATAAKTSDAMTFIGVWSNATDIPDLTEVHNGDCYRASSNISTSTLNKGDFIYAGGATSIKTGDLIIAKGAQDASTGKIADKAESGAGWYVIPSGDELQYVGTVSTGDKSITINDNSTSQATLIGLKFVEDANNTIAIASSNSNNAKVNEITLSHKAYTAITKTADGEYAPSASGNTCKVITGLVVDNYGHVTGATQTDLTLKDSHANLKSDGVTEISGGVVSLSIEDTDNKFATVSFGIDSETLIIGSDNANKKVSVDLAWGTF